MLAATSVLDWIEQNPSLSLAGAIVLVGLVGLGLRDVLRLSIGRTLAIASVNFRQAVRRRVLWITPLLMAAVIVINQFQRPLDAQDAMRQITMICLFATGLLVTLVILMLACTSLPHEIDTRVIYTVATKPATRLEIILGKIAGFAAVAFCILLIMGLFTWGYVRACDWQMRKAIAAQLANPGQVTDSLRPTLEYYRDNGTLHARTLGLPESLNIYAHEPQSPDDRWSAGVDEGEIVVPFILDRAAIPAAASTAAQGGPDATMGPAPAAPAPPALLLRIPVKMRKMADDSASPATTSPTTAPLPHVGITVADVNHNVFLNSKDFGSEGGWEVSEAGTVLMIPMSAKQVNQLIGPNTDQGAIIVTVVGGDTAYEYTVNPTGLLAIVPETQLAFPPAGEVSYAGRSGQYGQQIRGGRSGAPRVAIYRFTGHKPADNGQADYAFELRMGVERVEDDSQVKVALNIHNRTTGQRFGPIESMVETNRPAYVNLPADALQGGDFDVLLHTPNDAWLGLQIGPRASIKLIKEDQSFAWNLAKSLSILWMLSLLVVIISVFCSTFLSWPIAVVLTVVILIGHWAAEQVSDIAQPGVGRQIVTDMLGGTSSAATSNAVSKSVDALVAMLRAVSAVLPDISQFSALQDIQQGLAISPSQVLLPALLVLLTFGLPLTVLSYVFLKYKEVAP